MECFGNNTDLFHIRLIIRLELTVGNMHRIRFYTINHRVSHSVTTNKETADQTNVVHGFKCTGRFYKHVDLNGSMTVQLSLMTLLIKQ